MHTPQGSSAASRQGASSDNWELLLLEAKPFDIDDQFSPLINYLIWTDPDTGSVLETPILVSGVDSLIDITWSSAFPGVVFGVRSAVTPAPLDIWMIDIETGLATIAVTVPISLKILEGDLDFSPQDPNVLYFLYEYENGAGHEGLFTVNIASQAYDPMGEIAGPGKAAIPDFSGLVAVANGPDVELFIWDTRGSSSDMARLHKVDSTNGQIIETTMLSYDAGFVAWAAMHPQSQTVWFGDGEGGPPGETWSGIISPVDLPSGALLAPVALSGSFYDAGSVGGAWVLRSGASVPTVNTWGLVVLFLGILTAASFVLRRAPRVAIAGS